MAKQEGSETVQKSNTSVGVNITTKSESTPIGEGLELDPYHFKTIPGILKLVQLLVAVICMGCGSPALADYARFFMFVVALYLILTIIICVIYFFSLKKALSRLPWIIIELVVTGSGTLLYLVASIVMLAVSSRRDYHMAYSLLGYYGSYIAAGVFALINTFLYGTGTFFLFKEWKESRMGTTGTSAAQNGNTPYQ